jgi:hypothetical protein
VNGPPKPSGVFFADPEAHGLAGRLIDKNAETLVLARDRAYE